MAAAVVAGNEALKNLMRVVRRGGEREWVREDVYVSGFALSLTRTFSYPLRGGGALLFELQDTELLKSARAEFAGSTLSLQLPFIDPRLPFRPPFFRTRSSSSRPSLSLCLPTPPRWPRPRRRPRWSESRK